MREYASASSCLAHFGGGKMRQTPCVLSLAKIINKEVLFILRRLVPSEIFDFVRDGEKFIKDVCRVGEGKRIKAVAENTKGG